MSEAHPSYNIPGLALEGAECFNCLTTHCLLWRSVGQYAIRLCNACYLDRHDAQCAFCTTPTVSPTDAKRQSHEDVCVECNECGRLTHVGCEQDHLGSHFSHCVVCDVTIKLEQRQLKGGRWGPKQRAAVLNHHIFNKMYLRICDLAVDRATSPVSPSKSPDPPLMWSPENKMVRCHTSMTSSGGVGVIPGRLVSCYAKEIAVIPPLDFTTIEEEWKKNHLLSPVGEKEWANDDNGVQIEQQTVQSRPLSSASSGRGTIGEAPPQRSLRTFAGWLRRGERRLLGNLDVSAALSSALPNLRKLAQGLAASGGPEGLQNRETAKWSLQFLRAVRVCPILVSRADAASVLYSIDDGPQRPATRARAERDGTIGRIVQFVRSLLLRLALVPTKSSREETEETLLWWKMDVFERAVYVIRRCCSTDALHAVNAIRIRRRKSSDDQSQQVKNRQSDAAETSLVQSKFMMELQAHARVLEEIFYCFCGTSTKPSGQSGEESLDRRPSGEVVSDHLSLQGFSNFLAAFHLVPSFGTAPEIKQRFNETAIDGKLKVESWILFLSRLAEVAAANIPKLDKDRDDGNQLLLHLGVVDADGYASKSWQERISGYDDDVDAAVTAYSQKCTDMYLLPIRRVSDSFNRSRELLLQQVRIGDEGAIALAAGLVRMSSLRKVDLSDTQLTPKGLKEVLQSIRGCVGLLSLLLCGNKAYGLGEDIVALVNTAMVLEELGLSRCSLHNVDLKSLCASLRHHERLKRIDLHDNRLGDVAACELAGAIRNGCPTLTCVDLRNNASIRRKGWVSLSSALSSSPKRAKLSILGMPVVKKVLKSGRKKMERVQIAEEIREKLEEAEPGHLKLPALRSSLPHKSELAVNECATLLRGHIRKCDVSEAAILLLSRVQVRCGIIAFIRLITCSVQRRIPGEADELVDAAVERWYGRNK